MKCLALLLFVLLLCDQSDARGGRGGGRDGRGLTRDISLHQISGNSQAAMVHGVLVACRVAEVIRQQEALRSLVRADVQIIGCIGHLTVENKAKMQV